VNTSLYDGYEYTAFALLIDLAQHHTVTKLVESKNYKNIENRYKFICGYKHKITIDPCSLH